MKNFWDTYYHIPSDTFISWSINGKVGSKTLFLNEGWQTLNKIHWDLHRQIDQVKDCINFVLNGNKITPIYTHATLGTLVLLHCKDSDNQEVKLEFFAAN